MTTALVIAIIIALFALGIWLGWRAAKADALIDRQCAEHRREVAINDEADMGEAR